MSRYKAVTREQLVNRLGRQCSPVLDRGGYVIGPDIYGQICHCSTHFTLGDAQRKAAELNEKEAKMSIDFCNDCEQVVEGNTVTASCPSCDYQFQVCRYCEGSDISSMSEDDPRRDDICQTT